jgi:predicted RNA-binding Zn-ribbon protein involved in translation (DUF1610 family)
MFGVSPTVIRKVSEHRYAFHTQEEYDLLFPRESCADCGAIEEARWMVRRVRDNTYRCLDCFEQHYAA